MQTTTQPVAQLAMVFAPDQVQSKAARAKKQTGTISIAKDRLNALEQYEAMFIRKAFANLPPASSEQTALMVENNRIKEQFASAIHQTEGVIYSLQRELLEAKNELAQRSGNQAEPSKERVEALVEQYEKRCTFHKELLDQRTAERDQAAAITVKMMQENHGLSEENSRLLEQLGELEEEALTLTDLLKEMEANQPAQTTSADDAGQVQIEHLQARIADLETSRDRDAALIAWIKNTIGNKTIPESFKLIYIYLQLFFAGVVGATWHVGMEEMAQKCGLSPATVRRATKQAHEHEILDRTEEKYENEEGEKRTMVHLALRESFNHLEDIRMDKAPARKHIKKCPKCHKHDIDTYTVEYCRDCSEVSWKAQIATRADAQVDLAQKTIALDYIKLHLPDIQIDPLPEPKQVVLASAQPQETPVQSHKIYHIGYRTDGALSVIKQAMQDNPDLRLIDIRFKPASRQPEWRGEAFKHAYTNRYEWLPDLGNLNYGGRGPIQIANLNNGLASLNNLLQTYDVLIMCGCPEACKCHRKTVLEAMGVDIASTALTPKADTPKADFTSAHSYIDKWQSEQVSPELAKRPQVETTSPKQVVLAEQPALFETHRIYR